MNKTYNLQVTEEQLKVISTACELLSRIQGGQILEAFDHLPLKTDIDWGIYNEIKNELIKRMPEILMNNIDGWTRYLGLGYHKLPDSHDIAYDLYRVIRYEISMEKAIESGIVSNKEERKFPEMMSVCYDKPLNYGKEPLATVNRVDS